MFFPFALLTLAIILIDAGWTKRSVLDVINGIHPAGTPTANQTAGQSTATVPSVGGGGGLDWIIGRRDQGIDITPRKGAGTPLPALFGTSKVIGIIPDWYNGQPYVWLQILSGPLKGHYYYYSEQITNIAPIGAVIPKGQPVCYFANSGTGVETGFAVADGRTLARATTGYTEGQVTPAANQFKKALGL